jgi:hypothetical protein
MNIALSHMNWYLHDGPSVCPQSDSQRSDNLMLIPPPDDDRGSEATKVDLGNTLVTLDGLGPMVVNRDGVRQSFIVSFIGNTRFCTQTLSRIANWSNMTELEKERTLRVLRTRSQ